MDWSQSSLSFPPPKGGCHTNQHNNTETHMANNQTNLTNLASSYYMTTSLSLTGYSFTKSFKKGKQIIASAENASSPDSFTSGRKLFPKGYDSYLTAMQQAQNLARTWFAKRTLSMNTAADGETASGDKHVPGKYVADGSFMAEFRAIEAQFLPAKQAFLDNYYSTIQRIERDGVLGDTFSWTDYPSLDEVDAKFKMELKGPFPIANTDNLKNLPLSADAIEQIEAQMEAQTKRQLSFGQQTLATQLTSYLQTMATNLSKLAEYKTDPSKFTKQTPIFESMVTNITDTLDKVRAYALPDTEAGSRLMDMVDKIEAELSPQDLNPDVIKSAPTTLTRTLASRASALADALASSDFEYH